MRAELHTTPDVFDRLKPEWDSLLDPGRSDNLYLCNDWQRIWWKHLHRGDLAVVSVRDDDGVLRGIGSWFIVDEAGQHVVHIVGCIDVTDYMDIIAQPGYEEAVHAALIDFMLSDDAPHWDCIRLCNIPEASPTVDLFTRLARARDLSVETPVQEVCPIIELPATYEEYLATVDKKQRHELRRKRRRAEGADVSWYVVGREHDLDAEIDRFFDLMALSDDEKADFLKEPGHRDFFREMGHAMAERGLLELIFLTVDGQPAATMWQFVYRDRMLLYNSGLNPTDFSALSPGIVLLTYSIEDAVERGLKIYDFLRGNEEYKYRMGAHDTRVYEICVTRQPGAPGGVG